MFLELVSMKNDEPVLAVSGLAMKGYVKTPEKIVDFMVNKLLIGRPHSPNITILDPGCGTGTFIEGIIRWYIKHSIPIPKIIGIESDSLYISEAQRKFEQYPSICIEQKDFLICDESLYDYIIGNPPYVPITKLSKKEKNRYRLIYKTAKGRFDLYLLFFEQALRNLKPNGRLVFITPEKFIYTETARPLRKILSTKRIEEIQMIDESTFGKLITYPTITTVTNMPGPCKTKVVLRSGRTVHVTFPTGGSSWLPKIYGTNPVNTQYTLADICLRISCGVATGADSVFIKETDNLDPDLIPFAYPTISGRELTYGSTNIKSTHSILVPYDYDGRLMKAEKLGAFMDYLSSSEIRSRLEKRFCVNYKPWYAFHETPPLSEILQPKILCKDITSIPYFWIDREGTIIPRHSVYYIVPKEPSQIDELAEFLKSKSVREWLESNCQRAANGFIRLQSHILKQLPISERLFYNAIVKNDDKQPKLVAQPYSVRGYQ